MKRDDLLEYAYKRGYNRGCEKAKEHYEQLLQQEREVLRKENIRLTEAARTERLLRLRVTNEKIEKLERTIRRYRKKFGRL